MARVAVLAVALETPVVVRRTRHAEGVVLVTGTAANAVLLLAMGDVQEALATNPCSVLRLLRPLAAADVVAAIPR